MQHPFSTWLDVSRPVLLDGGLSSELESRGYKQLGKLGSAALVRQTPSALRAIHRDYLEAGAHVVTSATFQAAMPTLRHTGLHAAEAEELLREAVYLADYERLAYIRRHPGRRRRLVAASVGPYGIAQQGGYGLSVKQLKAYHIQRWQVLADTPADFIACETVPDFTEIQALARLMFLHPQTWATLGLLCRDERHLADGTPLTEVLKAVQHVPNLAAIGLNCVPPSMVAATLDGLSSYATAPLMVYAKGAVDPELSPAQYARLTSSWLAYGAQVLGGCCGTTPEHIAAMAELPCFTPTTGPLRN